MKNTVSPNNKSNIQFNTNKHRSENKDNLDSRAGEEQDFKGTGTTHNKKAVKDTRKKTAKE